MDCIPYLSAALIGYLLGAIPCGYLVARAHGVDIFKVGSGNPGATNVRRVLGSKAGNLVFAFDAFKGSAAAGWMLVCARLGCPLFAQTDGGLTYVQLTGIIAAILGHSFSVFTGFKGGKGVATAAGGLVVLIPLASLTAVLVWIVAFYLTRYVSLGSILAAIALPLTSWLQHNPLALNIVVSLIGLFVVFRHRENIKRLLQGTESKFVRK